MTLMDRKKTFGKRTVRNNIEVMNPLQDYDQMHDEYPGASFSDLNPYAKMGNYH